MEDVSFINFEELPSTNSYALMNINSLVDKTVIVANVQTEGKGRLGRAWISDNSENLYFTLVLKSSDNKKISQPFVNLTQYMSVILCKIFQEYGVKAQIKWPNDVLVKNKKIAGILSEASTNKGQFEGIVLGVGVNLNSTPEDIKKINQKATSLNLEISEKINKKLFLDKLLEKFFKGYDEFLSKGFKMIKEEYIQSSSFLGSEVTVSNINSDFKALAESVLDDGSLYIKIGDEYKSINSGDITLV